MQEGEIMRKEMHLDKEMQNVQKKKQQHILRGNRGQRKIILNGGGGGKKIQLENIRRGKLCKLLR